jgi:hypothetical protein
MNSKLPFSNKTIKHWLSTRLGKFGKRIVRKTKYQSMLYALCDYVNEIVISRAIDNLYNRWYNERLAAAALMLLLIVRKDGIRFLANLDAEARLIARSAVKGDFAKNTIHQWNKFYKKVAAWRRKYYPSAGKPKQGGSHEN